MKSKIRINLIKFYMWENNLSKEEFCELCNISVKTLDKIFKHDYSIKVESIENISKVINVPLVLLFEVCKKDEN